MGYGRLCRCFWMMEEFGEDHGVVYADRPEDALRRGFWVDWGRGG